MTRIDLPHRPRRNRKSPAIRALVRENNLDPARLIAPLFVIDAADDKRQIRSMPDQFQLGLNPLLREIEESLSLGISGFVLFPAVEERLKDKTGTYGYSSDNFYLKTAATIKEKFPEAFLISDVALDPYSSDGHDGYVEGGVIVNDKTLGLLARQAIAQAQAGFDMLGPSDMMDGRVGYIRSALDQNGYTDTGIMAYTAKYASAFYGPFRDALDSAPRSGDKKTYQMDPANSREAIRECLLDEEEGADIVMVKPALSYLDVIQTIRNSTTLPVAAYNVSGEYAMIKAAAANGWLDEQKAMVEVLLSIRRAGADMILSYFAKAYAKLVRSGYTYH